MYSNPIAVVETDGTAWFQIINPELGSSVSLLGHAEACKSENVFGFVQKLCKPTLKAVVRGNVIEHGMFAFAWSMREVATPAEWQSLGQLSLIVNLQIENHHCLFP